MTRPSLRAFIVVIAVWVRGQPGTEEDWQKIDGVGDEPKTIGLAKVLLEKLPH